MGGEYPLRAPCLCREGSPLTTDPWEAEDPHSRRQPGHHPHRSGEQHRHQSGCHSTTRRHPPPPSQGGRGRGGRGHGGMMGPQPQGPVYPQPFGMPGLLQPPGHEDPVQRLALMMALMVLGMPPVYSCHVPTGCGMPLGADMSEPRVCPPIESETGI
jgi:hypothetical protein